MVVDLEPDDPGRWPKPDAGIIMAPAKTRGRNKLLFITVDFKVLKYRFVISGDPVPRRFVCAGFWYILCLIDTFSGQKFNYRNHYGEYAKHVRRRKRLHRCAALRGEQPMESELGVEAAAGAASIIW